MCTTGAVLGRPSQNPPYLLAFKTLDSGPTGIWHSIVRFGSGTRAMALGTTGQQGINSGMNHYGLTVVLSYLDVIVPEASMTVEDTMMLRAQDTRTLANAFLLDRCRTVSEGAQFLDDFFRRHPSAVGGNHILADGSGIIGNFEHCGGERIYREVTDDGLIGRGNDGYWVRLSSQQSLPEPIRRDRSQRSGLVIETLKGVRRQQMHKADTIATIQKMLSSHGEGGAKEPGSICSHGVNIPGARYATTTSNTTSTAMIIDIFDGRMLYTSGPPCQSKWNHLALKGDAYAVG